MTVNRRKAVFIRVGWMKYYGYRDNYEESPIGGGSYNIDYEGSEKENYRDFENYFYGFCQIGSNTNGFNLKRIDRNFSGIYRDIEIEDVTVIHVATHPDQGTQRIIGWYLKSKVFSRSFERNNGYGYYNISAEIKNSLLLPANKRIFEIPNGAGAMGRSPVCYIYENNGKVKSGKWINEAFDYIENYSDYNLISESSLGTKIPPREPIEV